MANYEYQTDKKLEQVKESMRQIEESVCEISKHLRKEIDKLRTLTMIHSFTLLIIAISLMLHTWLTR